MAKKQLGSAPSNAEDAATKGYVDSAVAGSGGSGDVVGPASSTDNALARFDGTTGKAIQQYSGATLDDYGNLVTDGNINSGIAVHSLILEKTSGAGVTIDGVLLKDGKVASSALEAVYPVGSLYMNRTVSTNPATLFGFGTWTAITDKMIMARGSTYTADGGSATHTHAVTGVARVAISGDNNNPKIKSISAPSGSWSADIRGGSGGVASSLSSSNGAELDASAVSSSNIPPMVVAYVWERTA